MNAIFALLLVALAALSCFVVAGLTRELIAEFSGAPVSTWDSGIAYWANRARYYETGPKAGWARGSQEMVRTCALLHDVSECCTEANCSWMCGHQSARLNDPSFVECEWITVEENARRLSVVF